MFNTFNIVKKYLHIRFYCVPTFVNILKFIMECSRLKMKYITLIFRSQGHSKECCYITLYRGRGDRLLCILTMLDYFKHMGIIEVHCEMLNIEYGMHSIYRSFTRTHKRVHLQYRLWRIIAGSTFWIVACVFKFN